MKTVEEIFETMEKKDESETIVEINKVMAYLRANERRLASDPESLSRAVVKLGLLKYDLGETEANLEFKADYSKAYRKNKEAIAYKKYRDQGETVKDSEMKADLDTEVEGEQELMWEYQKDLVKNLYTDVADMITIIQTRLRNIRGEMITSSTQV